MELTQSGCETSMEVALREIPSQDVLRLKEEQAELDSILGQAANIRLHTWSPSQWTLNFVPSVYRSGIPMENQTLRIKEPQGLYLDSLSPKRIC